MFVPKEIEKKDIKFLKAYKTKTNFFPKQTPQESINEFMIENSIPDKIFSKTFSDNIHEKSRNNQNLTSNNFFKEKYLNLNIVLGVTNKENKKLKNENEEIEMAKTSPYSFKYFCNTANKKYLYRALSGSNSIQKINTEMESNFMTLSKDANKYTSNANYIKNKKLLLFDKYIYDNNIYKPNRANLFDMANIPSVKNKHGTIYKTTIFRGGRLFITGTGNKIKNRIAYSTKNDFYNFSPSKTNYIDNSYQKSKRHPPSNSLYKELMSKKNEIFDNILINMENESTLTEDKNNKFVYPVYLPKNSSEEKKVIKKVTKNENLNGYSKCFSKKKNDGVIPILFPAVYSNKELCNSISQRNRYENIMENFVKLKSLILNNKKFGNELEENFIKEFCLSKQIPNEKINKKTIKNFSNFLKNKVLPVDTSKSLKENIYLALNFDNEKNIKNHNANFYLTEPIDLRKKKKRNYSENIIPETKLLKIDKNSKSRFLEKNHGNNEKIRELLKEELDLVEDEIENKQKKIRQVEDSLNLIPFSTNYYFKLNLNKNFIKDKKELRLISKQGYYKAFVPVANNPIVKRKTNSKDDLFNSNERLYYTWYKNKNKGNLENFIKKTKLTEYIMYGRTNDKILKNHIKEIIGEPNEKI